MELTPEILALPRYGRPNPARYLADAPPVRPTNETPLGDSPKPV